MEGKLFARGFFGVSLKKKFVKNDLWIFGVEDDKHGNLLIAGF